MDVPFLLSKAQMRRIEPFFRFRMASRGLMTVGSCRGSSVLSSMD